MLTLLIVCPLVFLGAFVDAIAGGGGLITLPAYYLAGLPPHFAMGTNKLSSSLSTTVSVARFARGGSIHKPTAGVAAVFALVGSWLGARLALVLSERVLQIVLLVALPIAAVFLLTRKKLEDHDDLPIAALIRVLPLSALSGLLIGAYDGFFGPGAGTFLILSFALVVRMPLRTAMGNSKVVNLASNIGAVFALGAEGKIMYSVGIPAAICGILGGYIGSGLALKNGAKIFRPVLIVVLTLLLIRIAWNFFSLQQ